MIVRNVLSDDEREELEGLQRYWVNRRPEASIPRAISVLANHPPTKGV